MTDTESLQTKLASTRRTAKWINVALWGIAVGVMAYGAGYVTELLLAHGAPPLTAWVLSFMVDLGLCVGLLADRELGRHGRRGWRLTGLRWTCAVMTWALNVAGAVWPGRSVAVDWVGVGTRSCGPVLLVVVAGTAAWVQQQLGEITAQIAAALERNAAEARAAELRAAEVDEAWTAALKEDRKRTADAAPQTTPTARPQTHRTADRKPAPRPDRTAVLEELVAAATTDPDSLPTAAELADRTGYSTRWADGMLAEARKTARTPRLVEAAR